MKCGAAARMLLYDGVGHGEFCTDYMLGSVRRDNRCAVFHRLGRNILKPCAC